MAWSVGSKINLEGKIAQNGADLLKKTAKSYEKGTTSFASHACNDDDDVLWGVDRDKSEFSTDQPLLVIRDLNGSG